MSDPLEGIPEHLRGLVYADQYDHWAGPLTVQEREEFLAGLQAEYDAGQKSKPVSDVDTPTPVPSPDKWLPQTRSAPQAEEFTGVFRDIQPSTEKAQPDTGGESDKREPSDPQPDKPKRKRKRKEAVSASELDVSQRSASAQKFVEEQRRAGRIFRSEDDLNSALLVAMEQQVEELVRSGKETLEETRQRRAVKSLPPTPVRQQEHRSVQIPSTARMVWVFIRKFAALGGGFLLVTSWTMLQIDEYALALLLLLLGLAGLSIQIYDWKGIEGHSKATTFLKSVAAILITVSLVYFSAVITKRKTGKSWSNLLEQNKTEEGTPSPTETATAQTEITPGRVPVKREPRRLLNKTPRQLLAFYEKGNTQLQADQLMEPFKGEWIRVTGTLASLSPVDRGVVATIAVKEGKHTDSVGASFNVVREEAKKRFMRLAPGDKITIEGRIAREQAGVFLYLVEAELIEP